MSLWRKLASARSLRQLNDVWHANKLSSPTVRAFLVRTQSARVALYNARKWVDEFGSPPADASTSTAQVAFMVTQANKAQLLKLGYSYAEVSKMTPAVALAIIAEAVPPVKFIDWLPAYHIRVKEEAEEAKRAAYAAAQAEAASDSARASVEADASPSSAIAVTPVEEGSGAIGTTVTPSSAVVPVVSADSDASSQKAT